MQERVTGYNHLRLLVEQCLVLLVVAWELTTWPWVPERLSLRELMLRVLSLDLGLSLHLSNLPGFYRFLCQPTQIGEPGAAAIHVERYHQSSQNQRLPTLTRSTLYHRVSLYTTIRSSTKEPIRGCQAGVGERLTERSSIQCPANAHPSLPRTQSSPSTKTIESKKSNDTRQIMKSKSMRLPTHRSTVPPPQVDKFT